MDAEEGTALISHAFELEEEDRLFQRWINGYQTMSFSDFKAAVIRPPEKPTAEILDDVANIMTAWEVERDGDI